jgi:hypothetical protein
VYVVAVGDGGIAEPLDGIQRGGDEEGEEFRLLEIAGFVS